MSMKRIFEDRVAEIFAELSEKSKKFIVFFKGFPASFYERMKSGHYIGLKDRTYNNTYGYIDAKQLFESKNQLMIQLLTTTENHLWGYYEEYIVLTEVLANLKESFHGDIYIVNNNLFQQYYFLNIDENMKRQLWDYYNSDATLADAEIELYMKLYSNIVRYSERQFALSFINKEIDEEIEVIDFYNETNIEMPNDVYTGELTSYYVNDARLELLKNDLQNGQEIKRVQIIIEKEEDKRKIAPFLTLTTQLNLPIYISSSNKFSNLLDHNGDEYLPILQKYWGASSEFRKLKIYKNPEVTKELMEISQGTIIADIIEQSEKAIHQDETYRDIFVTSPTGSGKSLLFQIPAIHLATKLNAITIVITPLIALMQDQVESLQTDRGITFATFINSDLPFQERERRIYGIKNGDYSIIYISPEFLLANSLQGIIGDRVIGLFVIDEAHLVTSWGRDFRADYWYLGNYVEKQRNSLNFSFPILCLTATAVYLGNDDVVFDTVSSLNLRNHKLYLGNVRRDDLSFDIQYIPKNEIEGNIDNFKIAQTVKQIEHFYEEGIKSIVYCPYTSQVDELYQALPNYMKAKVGKYYGRLDKYEKETSYENFKDGKYVTMICTKAFGMGIDISDIEVVYHFAPTGNLADYVQEIGRSARNKELRGIAMTHFTDKDMKYVRMLHGLSKIKHYQLKEMVRKIYEIYKEKKNRNFLISTDAFSYLFSEEDIENKVKNGLLLISKDLEEKSRFPVLIVRPKSMYTKNFINVPLEIEEEFLSQFKSFVRKVENVKPRVIPSMNKSNSDIRVYNLGNVYEMNMSLLWEERFNDLTFPEFKWKFFNGELIKYSEDVVISPRINIIIHYKKSFEEVSDVLKKNIQMVTSMMAQLKAKGQYFTKQQFRDVFHQRIDGNQKNKELANLILDSFIADISQNIGFNQNRDPLKFIQGRKSQKSDEMEYRIMNSNYTRLLPYFTRLLSQSLPNVNETTFSTYIPLGRGKNSMISFN